jgi:hypothetical protein
VRSSLQSSGLASLAIVLVAGSSLSAHRLDEYLQAARLAIDPDRVEIVLDLTAGVAVAERVLTEIDGNGDRTIAPSEGQAYAQRVLESIALEVDGRPLRVEAIDSAFPTVDEVLQGVGTVRLRAQASLPGLGAGAHQIRYRNAHRPDIGVYLANALVPASDRVAVTAQRRDVDQRDVTVEYTLQADAATRLRAGVAVAAAGALVLLVVLWRRRADVRVSPAS